MKVQLNFQVNSTLAGKVRADARRHNKVLDDVGSIILGDFFNSFSSTERARFYAGARKKGSGRKVSQ